MEWTLFLGFLCQTWSTENSALHQMCNMEASIQSQLEPSYQDDQHLRDVLMNACKRKKNGLTDWLQYLQADCWKSKKPYLEEYQLKKS